LRLIYVLLTYLLAPVLIAIEGWRELSHPAWRGRVRERLGFIRPASRPGCLWVHAVSVGEVQAAAALIRDLERRVPGLEIVITTVTPTGAERARALFGDRVRHCYFPYDLPGAVRRFLDRLQPQLAVILETEIWPTLYGVLHRRGVPVVLASARLTQRSVVRYRSLGGVFSGALSGGVTIGAQTEADAQRFRAVGAPAKQVTVTGNVKFDLEIPAATIAVGRECRRAWGASRPVWIAGSTHDGEEQAALDAHVTVRERHPRALLILVPRHPPRFDAVRSLLDGRAVRYVARSGRKLPSAEDELLLIDTLGELQAFYAASDVAFVGGSLVPIGGHSLLEPAELGLPILSGPHTQNAAEVADLLRDSGALAIVHNASDLAHAVVALFNDPDAAKQTGQRGQAAVAASRGAVARVVELILPRLRASTTEPAVRPAVASGSAALSERGPSKIPGS
jgi:3-deoxy-D-manno-octulosonic-acid transferase